MIKTFLGLLRLFYGVSALLRGRQAGNKSLAWQCVGVNRTREEGSIKTDNLLRLTKWKKVSSIEKRVKRQGRGEGGRDEKKRQKGGFRGVAERDKDFTS